jgi:hypothetical protein
MALRLVSEAKGIEEIEEKVAKVVFEWGRSMRPSGREKRRHALK